MGTQTISASITHLISDISQIGFVGFTGVFYAMGKAGAGRHQWDVSLLNYMKVNRVTLIPEGQSGTMLT